MRLQSTIGFEIINKWLTEKGYHPFTFQQESWQHIIDRDSGLVNAPTGCGKTFAVFLGVIIDFINNHPKHYQAASKSGLQLLWITPLRALAKDIGRAMEEVIFELGMSWKIGIRNGDTNTGERQKQKRQMPEVLIITPESLHLLLAQKNYPDTFSTLKMVAVDEWHELLGSKRGVQVELAISRLIGLRKKAINAKYLQIEVDINADRHPDVIECPVAIWGISATVGNLDQAMEVLMACTGKEGTIVKAHIDKLIEVESVFPDEIEKYPWAGHLGLSLVEKVIPIIKKSKTTLIFINTRGMSERWYQAILRVCPDLAGAIALHHGSIERELR